MRAMVAPPPDGPSQWQPDFPAARTSSGLESGDGANALSPLRRAAAVERNLVTPWLWLPLGLSTMLLVLFAVVVNRQQAQAQRIGELLSRVQALEHSRALERTAVLEQQLRSMLARLQDLEKQNQGTEQLARELLTLQKELELVRSLGSHTLPGPMRELPPLQAPAAGRTVRPSASPQAMP